MCFLQDDGSSPDLGCGLAWRARDHGTDATLCCVL
jgi:hypothetical protein